MVNRATLKTIFFFLFGHVRNVIYMFYGLFLKYIYGWLDELYTHRSKKGEEVDRPSVIDILNGKNYPPRRYRLIEEEVAGYNKLSENEKQFLLSAVRDTLTRYRDSRSSRWVLLYSFNVLRMMRKVESGHDSSSYINSTRLAAYRGRINKTVLCRNESCDTIAAEIDNDLHSCKTSLSSCSYKTASSTDLSNHFHIESDAHVDLTGDSQLQNINLQKRSTATVERIDLETDSNKEIDGIESARDATILIDAIADTDRDIALTTKRKIIGKNTEDLNRLKVLRWQLDTRLDELPLLDATVSKIRNYTRNGGAIKWLNRMVVSLSSAAAKIETEIKIVEALLEILSAPHIAERCFSTGDDTILKELDDKNTAAVLPSTNATGKEMIYSVNRYSGSLRKKVSRYIYSLLDRDRETKKNFYDTLYAVLVLPVLQTINVINTDTVNPALHVKSTVYARDSFMDKDRRTICIREGENNKIVDRVVQPCRFDEYDEDTRKMLDAVKNRLSRRLASYVYEAKHIDYLSMFVQYTADIAKDLGIANDDDDSKRTLMPEEFENDNRLSDIIMPPSGYQLLRCGLMASCNKHLAAERTDDIIRALFWSSHPEERIFDQLLEEFSRYHTVLNSMNIFLPNDVQKRVEKHIKENWEGKLSHSIRDKSITMFERVHAYEKFIIEHEENIAFDPIQSAFDNVPYYTFGALLGYLRRYEFTKKYDQLYYSPVVRSFSSDRAALENSKAASSSSIDSRRQSSSKSKLDKILMHR